ncbi:MAG: Lectin C-type domain, partial [Chloroflexota bacterium]
HSSSSTRILEDVMQRVLGLLWGIIVLAMVLIAPSIILGQEHTQSIHAAPRVASATRTKSATPIPLSTSNGCYWKESNGIRHRYEILATRGWTWSEAKTAAEASEYNGIAGALASIHTLPEQTCLYTMIQSMQISGRFEAWTGGTDSAVEGTWRWSGGRLP